MTRYVRVVPGRYFEKSKILRPDGTSYPLIGAIKSITASIRCPDFGSVVTGHCFAIEKQSNRLFLQRIILLYAQNILNQSIISILNFKFLVSHFIPPLPLTSMLYPNLRHGRTAGQSHPNGNPSPNWASGLKLLANTTLTKMTRESKPVPMPDFMESALSWISLSIVPRARIS